jgi:hypothetical protein
MSLPPNGGASQSDSFISAVAEHDMWLVRFCNALVQRRYPLSSQHEIRLFRWTFLHFKPHT